MVVPGFDGTFFTALVLETTESTPRTVYKMDFDDTGYVDDLYESCGPGLWNLCAVEEEDWPVTIKHSPLRNGPLATYFGVLNADWAITPMRPVAHEVQCQFLGDSMFSYYALHPDVWAELAARDCYNTAIAGELVENLLERMLDRAPFSTPGYRTQGFIDENLPPETVFLFAVGTNNVKVLLTGSEWPEHMSDAEIAIEVGTQVAMGQLAALARLRAVRPEARAAFLELIPQAWTPSTDLAIREANRLLAAFTGNVQDAWLMPVYDEFLNPDGSRNLSLYFVDGVHPSREGYVVITDSVTGLLDSLE